MLSFLTFCQCVFVQSFMLAIKSSNKHDFLFDFHEQHLSISHRFRDIFGFKVFRVWPWPLTPKGHLGWKMFIQFESSYMTSYLTSMDTISLSRTVLEIFDFKVFRVWPFDLLRSSGIQKIYHSKAHIWLLIWLLWTPSLYPVPFSR